MSEVSLVEQHALHSVLRERICEHLLVGSLLRRLWSESNVSVEILRAEFDRGGYDLVADFGSITRHIQLKCSRIDGTTVEQTVSLNLAKKPSGCVIWAVIDDALEFQHFLWFGGEAGEALPSLEGLKTAKHVKANALGIKLDRPNLRKVPRRLFRRIDDVDGLLTSLFGPSWRRAEHPSAASV